MKTLFKFSSLKIFLSLLLVSFIQTFVFAQDDGGSSVTTTTHTESQTWYMEPWVWVVGGLVLLILLIALLRGSNNKVTVTKTTTTDTP